MEALTIRPGAEIQAAPNIADLLNRFADYIDVKEITEKSYGVALRCFAEWMQHNGITAPQRADILEYINTLPNRTNAARGQTDAPQAPPP